MPAWPIDRVWSYVADNGERRESTTSELSQHRVLCLLGGAGLGKTFELRKLAELEKSSGNDVRIERLAVLASDPGGVSAGIDRLCLEATHATIVYLDALDEALVAEKKSALGLLSWVKNHAKAFPGKLRITSRPATWPGDVTTALQTAVGPEHVVAANLSPLTEAQINSIAASEGIDSSFLAEVVRVGAFGLAQQPLSLRMLLTQFRTNGRFPARRNELFKESLFALACEPAERRDMNTASPLAPDALLALAEDVACFALLSGKECFSLSDSSRDSDISWRELVALRRRHATLITEEQLKLLGSSALFEKDDAGGCRFIHRQIAEYLAGRRLASLPIHQARSLLACGLGWNRGVAGPMREIAAFAAAESSDIAQWVCDTDPEIIGLSDVASDDVRKRAVMAMMERFERHELTDSLVHREGIEVAGFRYQDAEIDLRPRLRQRGAGVEDLLEFVLELVEGWGLTTLSEEMADLALDRGAPARSRLGAAYTLAKIGTEHARRRLLPLIEPQSDDEEWQLKGVALRCNWPGGLTVPKLLEALKRPPQSSLHGGYEDFLFQLDQDGFKADGARVEGLQWAKTQFDQSPDTDSGSRIGAAIARAALEELDNPEIFDALCDLILAADSANAASPLRAEQPLPSFKNQPELPAPLIDRPIARRALIEGIAQRLDDEENMWYLAAKTPGMLNRADFKWACQCVIEIKRSDKERKHFAQLARMLYDNSSEHIDIWLVFREHELICAHLNWPTEIVLGSPEAVAAKARYEEQKIYQDRMRRKPRKINSTKELQKVLAACDENPLNFDHIPAYMTVTEDGRRGSFGMFLKETRGWEDSDNATRTRIVHAAEKFLDNCESFRTAVEELPLNEGQPAAIAAIDLLMNDNPAWINAKDSQWWSTWTWYILRELRPQCHGEPDEPKLQLLRTLCQRDPEGVRRHICRLASENTSQGQILCDRLLTMLSPLPDAELDQQLCSLIEQNRVTGDRALAVAGFVLSRSLQAPSVCLARLYANNPATAVDPNDPAVEIATALLGQGTGEVWDQTMEALEPRQQFAKLALGKHLHSAKWRRSPDEEASQEMSIKRVGRLVSLLMECYPPEQDPKRDGVYFAGPKDSAVQYRQQMTSWLGDQPSLEAVQVLEGLEKRFGERYAWLRRPRARAYRSYRLAQWNPVPVKLVADILEASDSRLLRSEADTLEGIAEAIRRYEHDLHHGDPSAIRDLWIPPVQSNGQRASSRATPSQIPREEEHCSDKLCKAIRDYFNKYAIGAEREVQIQRRLVPKDASGDPGSNLDVLVRAPARGVVSGKPIVIPVEVKRSCNDEAKTGLRGQLVNRYMRLSDAPCGVFVVMWFDAPGLSSSWKPVWKSKEEAQVELDAQAAQVSKEVGVTVIPLIVDCTIR